MTKRGKKKKIKTMPRLAC